DLDHGLDPLVQADAGVVLLPLVRLNDLLGGGLPVQVIFQVLRGAHDRSSSSLRNVPAILRRAMPNMMRAIPARGYQTATAIPVAGRTVCPLYIFTMPFLISVLPERTPEPEPPGGRRRRPSRPRPLLRAPSTSARVSARSLLVPNRTG